MKQKINTYEMKLTTSAVDECSDLIRRFLAMQKLLNRDIVRYTMTVEEILLKAFDSAGRDTSFVLMIGIRFLRPFISLEIEGKACNVFSVQSSEQSVLGSSILKNLGLSPEYSYINDVNTYFFRIRKKTLNPFVTLIIALVSAAVIGLLGLMLPDNIRIAALDGVMTPLHDTFLNVLGCIAGPMVFLSVAWGIYGIGDAAALKRIGKKCCKAISVLFTFLRLYSV